jgi:hypothetical protein
MPSASQDGARVRGWELSIAGLLGLGVLVRIWAFVRRGALWNDEAGLALNIVGQAFHDIARPFVHQQYAPYLYVLSDKLMSLALGASEHALRLPSLLAGLALLPVLSLLAFRVGDASSALFALALLVPNGLSVYYSTELKPYEQDALICATLLLLTVGCLRAATDHVAQQRTRALLGLCGVFAPWFSLPAILLLAAAGLALVIDAKQQRAAAGDYGKLAALGAAWITSFAVHYALFLRASPADAAELHQYWAGMDAFGPFPPHSLADLRWYVAKFFYLFNLFGAQDAVGVRYLVAGVWLWGMHGLWQRERAVSVLIAAPFLLLLAAAAARLYVISDRTVLFMAPLVLVPTALGLAALSRLRGIRSQIAAGTLTAAFCVAPVVALARSLQAPSAPSDIRTLVRHLKDHVREGDRVYVETQVDWIYAFYARREALRMPYAKADSRMDSYDPREALAVLEGIKDAPRVWALLPTIGPGTAQDAGAVSPIRLAERVVTDRMRQLGREVESVDGGNVRLYLYDLTPTAAANNRR